MARRTRSNAARCRTFWEEFAPGPTTVSASGSTLLGTFAAPSTGLTVARIRGLLSATLLTTAAAADGFFGAIGFGVVSLAAATAGVASLSTPITEMGWDGWMLHEFFDVRRGGTGDSNGSGHFDVVLDSKAMRIIDGDENVLVGVLEVVEVGTCTAVIHAQCRILSMAT